MFNACFDIEHIFSYHSPTGDQPQKYEAIRKAAKEFAKVLIENTPTNSVDQDTAIYLLRQCVMIANASVALDGRLWKIKSSPTFNTEPAVDVRRY